MQSYQIIYNRGGRFIFVILTIRMDIHLIEKFVQDLRKEGFLERYTIDDNMASIYLQQYVLFVYLGSSPRWENDSQIKAIHLDIDMLNTAYDKVFNRIRGLCGVGERVYARNTVVARIDKRIALDFLVEHHLNAPLAGKYRYGLFYQGELVSVAVFSGGRIMSDINMDHRSFELLRFCHKAGYLVVGGISKLIKAFVKDFRPHDIMTYADRDWSQHSSLESIGFKATGMTGQQTFYVKDGKRLAPHTEGHGYDYEIKNKGSIKLKLYL